MYLPFAVMAMSTVDSGPATLALDALPGLVAIGTGRLRHMTYTVDASGRPVRDPDPGGPDVFTCWATPPNAPVMVAMPAATAATHAVHALALMTLRRRRRPMALRSAP